MSYAKIQNISTANRLLGSTSANGEVSEVTVSTAMIDNSAITTDKLNADSVTTAKIVANAVTATEINNDAVITAKINDDAVTYAKIQNISTANRLLGSTTANGEVSEVRITNDMITDSTIDLTTKVTGVLPIDNFATKDEDDMASALQHMFQPNNQ